MHGYPKRYKQVYTFKVEDNYLGVWQPLSDSGLTVLSQGPILVYNLCDGIHSPAQILKALKRYDLSVTMSEIKRILQDLEKKQLISWQFTPRSQITFKPPTTLGVWLHTTNQCNLRCRYCYVHKTNEVLSESDGIKAIKSALSSAKKHGFDTVKFKYSGGEALLRYQQFIKQVRYAKSQAQKVAINVKNVLLTNGVLITSKIAEDLKLEGVKVMVSLDGSQKYHDLVRVFPNGGATYQYVQQGIALLQKYSVDFNLSVTITKENIDGIPELVSKLLKQKIRFVLNFFRENCESGSVLKLNDQSLITTMKKVYKLVENEMPKYPMWDALLDRVTMSWPHLNACGVGRNYITVDQKGYLASCPIDLANRIGNIDQDLVDVMNSHTFMRGITVERKEGCRTCLWRYVCGGGCPILTKEVNGSYLTKSPYCGIYKELIPEILKLEAKRVVKYCQ